MSDSNENKNDNVIFLNKWKFDNKDRKKKKEQSRKVPTLMAFQPNQYYINPDKGAMIHVLFITDKSDIFDRQMIYVMEDPAGTFYCALVENHTYDGWHELHEDVFTHEVLKKRYEDELPPFPPPEPSESA